MSNNQNIYKKPKWTGRSTVGLGHTQSIIDLRRTFFSRLSHAQSRDESKDDSRVVLNISGLRFETLDSTLQHYPETLLGDHRRRALFYHKRQDEYFFDRHRLCFEAILYYYQSHGRLRRPENVPLDTFLEEIIFFDLGPEALEQVQQAENLEEAQIIHLPKNRLRRFLWTTLEYPQYSLLAKIINIISLFFILLSAVGLAVETLPVYHRTTTDQCQYEADGFSVNTNGTLKGYQCQHIFTSPFYIIQAICIVFFTLEFLLRLVSCPSYLQFLKSILNWIDILAIVPFYIRLIIILVRLHYKTDSNVYLVLRLLRMIRFIRIFKLYRVFKSSKSLRVLASTLKESLPDFIIILTFLSLSGFLFGAAFYFTENAMNQDMFDSIPKATYYGIMTITAVGYGDLSPVTPLGRALASLCAIFGISVVSMLVSVLAEKYQRVYTRKLFLNEKYSDNPVFEGDEDQTRSLSLSKTDYYYQTSSTDNGKSTETSKTTDEGMIFKGIPEERKDSDDSSKRIQFVIGFLSNDSVDEKEVMMTEIIKDLLQKKLGKQCLITRTDVVMENTM
ncbi:unnamed protein product [Adineta ricciae]|uniref:BTB domain-containing protein n=1 Tax=Adineta ricciae TaxID=249248 RepID=A0A813UZH7_ADIRI|nr:unnamed protein product [Adineta ricciae]